MRKYLISLVCAAALTSTAAAQVIFYPPVVREFVDHPFNPELDPRAVARLASLLEPCGMFWPAANGVFINAETGERIWPLDTEFHERFGDRMILSSQPLYFRKADLLPAPPAEEMNCAEAREPEMVDVRDLAAAPASAPPPATQPAGADDDDDNDNATADRNASSPRGSIVIKPYRRAPASDNADRMSN